MNYHHEDRERSPNGLPLWRGSMIVLPTIDVRPTGAALDIVEWEIRVMDGGSGSWRFKLVSLVELAEFLLRWEMGPEETFEAAFGVAPPKGLGAHSGASPSASASVAPKAGTTAEDLGL